MTNAQKTADAILQQLGARRFLVMTGAKNLVATGAGLVFSLPARFAKDGVNLISVELDPSDTYVVTAFKKGRAGLREVAQEAGIYCDGLQASFTRLTGLDTHL